MSELLNQSERFTFAINNPATFGEVARRGQTNPLESNPKQDFENYHRASVGYSVAEFQHNPDLLVQVQEDIFEAVKEYYDERELVIPPDLVQRVQVGSSDNIVTQALEGAGQPMQGRELTISFYTELDGTLNIAAVIS